MSFKNLIIIALVFSACDARKYGNCEVAKRLDEMKVSRSEIPIYLCLMKHLSDGNSSLIKNRHTRNEALGIFQIRSNSCGWKKSSGLCKSECKRFTDEAVCDDLRCAIENQKKSGFGYWSEYNSKCNPFIKGFEVLPNLNKLRCFDDNVNILIAMKPRFCK